MMTNNNGVTMTTKNLCKTEKHRTKPRAVPGTYHGKAFPICLKRKEMISYLTKLKWKKTYWNNSNVILSWLSRKKMNTNQTL